MKCIICKNGETKPGNATVTLEREGTTLVIKGVPADVCANCGEEYVDETITLAY
jgi:YgiT-type zinc finger domain-containing protein